MIALSATNHLHHVKQYNIISLIVSRQNVPITSIHSEIILSL